MQQKTSKKIKNRQLFSERFYDLRKKLGINQRQLSKNLGFSTNTQISKFENAASEPSLETLRKMAQIYNIDIHELVTGQPSPGAAELVECLKPCIGEYLSQLHKQIEQLRGKQIKLDLGRLFQGESNAEKISKVDAKIEQLQKEYDHISKVVLHITKRSFKPKT